MDHGVALTHDSTIMVVNDALCRLTGFSREELVGSELPFPFIPPESRASAVAVREELIARGGGEFDMEMIRRDGTRFHAGVTASAVLAPDGTHLGLVNTMRDISERRRHEDELARRASRDGLTGLLNREALDATLRAEIADAAATGRPLTLALLDLDHFKAINDAHGHPVGDTVLIEAARRLRLLSRDTDRLGRVGGEEFAWILHDTEPPAAARAAERACDAIRRAPFADAGRGDDLRRRLRAVARGRRRRALPPGRPRALRGEERRPRPLGGLGGLARRAAAPRRRRRPRPSSPRSRRGRGRRSGRARGGRRRRAARS